MFCGAADHRPLRRAVLVCQFSGVCVLHVSSLSAWPWCASASRWARGFPATASSGGSPQTTRRSRSCAERCTQEEARAVGTAGDLAREKAATDEASRGRLVEEIKGQLQREMGLVPIRVLRERRASFVPVHAYDESGSLRYGTAGYLGGGYFITVKHGVLALDGARSDRRIESVKIVHDGKEIAATVVDSGTPTSKCIVATGRFSRCAPRSICRRCTSMSHIHTTLPSRSFGWATTIPRASSSARVMSASGWITDWYPVSQMAILASRAGECSTPTEIS